MKRNLTKWILCPFAAATFLFVIIGSSWALPTTINIDSKATYLQTFNDPSAINATPIDLSSLGIVAGDFIRLEQVGDIKLGAFPFQDVWMEMIGVFSSSSSLGPSTDLNRVTGAIEAGQDFDTLTAFIPIGGQAYKHK